MADPIVIPDSSSDDDDVMAVVSVTPALQSTSAAAAAPATASTSADTTTASPPPAAAAAADAPVDGGASSSSATADEKEQMECPICLQTCIHPARLPCGHIFCFLCVKGVAYKNRRCAMCRREIPVEFLDHPHLLYKIEETPPTSEDGYQWFYEGRNGWWQYDERTSQEIEDAYKRPDKSCTILVAGYVYTVDFETMLQQRQNEPTRKRQVKRDLATVPKKGVAGLRIDGTADPLESSAAALASNGGGGGGESSARYEPMHIGSATERAAVSLTSRRSPLPALVTNNLISTIAATDAAIRIASDIIDSTLAHASTDSGASAHGGASSSAVGGRRRRSGSGSNTDTDNAANDGTQPEHHHSTAPHHHHTTNASRRDLLNEVHEALNIADDDDDNALSTASSIALGAAVAAAAAQAPRLDFFSQTIDEFRSLALSNIAESSADSDSDDERNRDDDDEAGDEDESGVDIGVQHLSGGRRGAGRRHRQQQQLISSSSSSSSGSGSGSENSSNRSGSSTSRRLVRNGADLLAAAVGEPLRQDDGGVAGVNDQAY